MPKKDGYQATQEIRSIEAKLHLPRIPIIALTANASADDHQLCRKSGMDDVITKPYRRQDLTEIFQQWLTADAIKTDSEETGASEISLSQFKSDDWDRSYYDRLIDYMGEDFDSIIAVIHESLSENISRLQNVTEEHFTSEDTVRWAHSLKKSCR